MQPHFGRTELRAETGGFVVSEIVFERGDHLACHAHGEPQLSAVIEGGTIETGSARTELNAASGAVIRPAGYAHQNVFLAHTRGFVIELHDARRDIFRDVAVARWVDVPHVAQLYGRIRAAMTGSDAGSPLALEAALLEFAAAVARTMAPEDAIAAAIRSIESEPSRRWSASMFAIDDFAPRFRRATGCSLPRFVLRSRVEMAKRMLAGTAEPIADVAIACGFFDQAHFTRAFVQATGATPRRFRARR